MLDSNFPNPASPSRSPGTPDAVLAAPARLRQAMNAAQRFHGRASARDRTAKLREKGLFLALDEPERIAERAARKVSGAVAAPELISRVKSQANMVAPSITAALERLIGSNDLLPVSYFLRGAEVGHAVGRVVTTDGQGHDISYGTAFLVAPDVVLTNHHVLPDKEVAGASVIQFNYQFGVDGQMEHLVTVTIDPDRYVSSDELDFALAGVVFAPGDQGPRAWLPLLASAAKIINDEPVTIVQHPNAQPKQVALRNNKVIDILPDFLHYTTDTAPGASGSPVFNDQWEVVALHHAGVPEVDENGQILTARGTPWNETMGDDAIHWIANEGVRISQIMAFLGRQTDLSPVALQMIHSLSSPQTTAPSTSTPPSSRPGSVLFAEPEEQKNEPTPIEAPINIAIPSVHPTEITIRLQFSGAPTPANVGAKEQWLSDLANATSNAALAGTGSDKIADWISGSQRTSAAFISKLNDGDVLLYNGTGVISNAIKFFTKSDVSHAALYLGAREGQMIGEAVGSGLIRDTPNQSFPGHNWVVVHRLRNPRDMTPVLKRGDVYLNQNLKYGYQQIVLLAVLLLIKHTRPSGILGKMVQAVSVAATEALNKFLESGKELMICSEFVYRAYDEAVEGGSNPYHLQVPGIALEAYPAAGALPAGVDPDSVLAKLQRHPDILMSGFTSARENMLVAPMPQNQGLLQEQAEKLLAEYLAEQRHGRRPQIERTEDFVSDTQVASAVSRFAIALTAVRHRATSSATPQEALAIATQEALSAGQLPPALQGLFRMPADFVTPRDLRESPTLFEAGRIF
jgi:V8-like Glu-specific endopeptidase